MKVLQRWVSVGSCAAVVALLLALTGSFGPGVAAQGISAEFVLGISAVNCDDQPPENITVPQEGCEPADGAIFEVATEDGEDVGSCTAARVIEDAITASCSVPIPFGATVIVTEDEASIPEGYVPDENPQTFTAPDGPPEGELGLPLFVNLLQDDGGEVGSDEVTVHVIAHACPSADADTDPFRGECEDLTGVTIRVDADGTEVDGSPFTTELGSIGFSDISFGAPADATLTLTQLDGLPEGYAPAAGYDPLTVAVADLEERGCGGESVCLYADLVNVPVAGTPGATPTTEGAVTIRTAECPPTSPNDPADFDPSVCTEPVAGAEFDATFAPSGDEATVTADAEGVAVVEVPAESTSVGLTGPPYARAGGGSQAGRPYLIVFCADEDGVEVPVEGGNPGVTATLEVASGEDIVCDWYVRPVPSEPGAPAATEPPIADADETLGFAAGDWRGAYADIDPAVYGRDCVAVYGAGSGYGEATLTFTLDEAPDPARPSALILTGLDDELAGENQIRVSVNGQTIYEGGSEFSQWEPAAAEVEWQNFYLLIEAGILQAGENVVTVANLADSANVGTPPYVLLAEAEVRVGVTGVGLAPGGAPA